MFQEVTVFDRLLAIGQFLESCLESGQEIACYDDVELALSLDEGQLEDLYHKIQAQALNNEAAHDLAFCCELGLDACDALFQALTEGLLGACRQAIEAAEEGRRLFWSTQDNLDGLCQETCLLA